VFRYINISIFALAVAGVASAGAIDPSVGGGYSSSDGTLFSNATIPAGLTYSNEITTFTGPSPAYPANFFSNSNIASYNGNSSAPNTSMGAGNACPYSNMFGGPTAGNLCEAPSGDFLFAESGTNGTTYTLDFTLDSSETIYGYEIFLSDDSTSGNQTDVNRGVTNISFYDGTPILANLVTDDTFVPAGDSYYEAFGSNKIVLTDEFSAGVSGTEFSFTFTSATNAPRIREIVAFDSPVPEPGTWMLAGLGMLGLFAATKLRNNRLQSKL